MFIRSERLFARPVWPEDLPELNTLIDDRTLTRHLARMPWPCRPGDAQAPRYPQFAITLPDQNGAQLIGMVGFADRSGASELAVWIGQEWRHRGFATEAVRAVLSLARAIGHCLIVAGHFTNNQAAARMLAKLAFAPTGQVRAVPCDGSDRSEPAMRYALQLCLPASDPVDPQTAKQSA